MIIIGATSYLSQFKPDVEATELALAFPITPDLRNITIAKVLNTYMYMWLYAFALQSTLSHSGPIAN